MEKLFTNDERPLISEEEKTRWGPFRLNGFRSDTPGEHLDLCWDSEDILLLSWIGLDGSIYEACGREINLTRNCLDFL